MAKHHFSKNLFVTFKAVPYMGEPIVMEDVTAYIGETREPEITVEAGGLVNTFHRANFKEFTFETMFRSPEAS